MIEGAYPKIIFSAVDEMAKNISEQTNQYIVKQLVSLEIDPDVLTKQTMEIQRLNDELDKYRWIPVSERLPEEEGEYICQVESECVCILGFTKDASKVDWLSFGKEFKGKALFYEFDYELGYYEREVVAWMPLPEPYKEAEG